MPRPLPEQFHVKQASQANNICCLCISDKHSNVELMKPCPFKQVVLNERLLSSGNDDPIASNQKFKGVILHYLYNDPIHSFFSTSLPN